MNSFANKFKNSLNNGPISATSFGAGEEDTHLKRLTAGDKTTIQFGPQKLQLIADFVRSLNYPTQDPGG